MLSGFKSDLFLRACRSLSPHRSTRNASPVKRG
jgi:hypothetical protein